jgi:hypothetical protein
LIVDAAKLGEHRKMRSVKTHSAERGRGSFHTALLAAGVDFMLFDIQITPRRECSKAE